MRLRAAGFHVVVPALTGVGERAHVFSGDVTLSTHVADVANAIRLEDLHRVVLVGHSYGGCVITGVAEELADRIDALVFLDAFVPDAGASLIDCLPVDHVSRMLAGAAQHRGIAVPPIPAEAFRVNAADAPVVNAKSTPQPLGCFVEAIRSTAGRERVARKTYIRAAGYPSPHFEGFFEGARAAGWETHRLDCGHDVMLDDPEALTAILLAHTAGT
jgi:pimeloyl-ACP methyl ester carboxylesterase